MHMLRVCGCVAHAQGPHLHNNWTGAIHESFLREILVLYRNAKVFSLKSFPLYGTSLNAHTTITILTSLTSPLPPLLLLPLLLPESGCDHWQLKSGCDHWLPESGCNHWSPEPGCHRKSLCGWSSFSSCYVNRCGSNRIVRDTRNPVVIALMFTCCICTFIMWAVFAVLTGS